MATDKIPGRERQPIPGAANSLLNTVKLPDNSKVVKDPKTQDVIDKIVKCFEDSAKYDKDIANAQSTALVEQVRSLLNILNAQQLQPAIEQIKESISADSLKNITSNLLMEQVNAAVEQSASSANVDELKQWMSETFSKEQTENVAEASAETKEEPSKSADNTESEDEIVDEYQNSTPAQNFQTLQDFINDQFDDLNKHLKDIPGQSGILLRISASIGRGFSGLMGGIGRIAKRTAGLFGVVGKITSGIKELGSKIGGAIASPFKKVGGFFKSLNPFSKSKEKAEERKQRLKDKIFNVMMNILEKLWKVIEPFIGKVKMFIALAMKVVIIPISIILAKILLVTAAIIALGVAAYIAYNWIKDKITSFRKYLTSGEIVDDIMSGLEKAWEWTKDFGKWLWDITIKALKYVFWDMWIDLSKWIWEKLCQFGNWLYDEFIDPYIVAPFKKYVWEPLKKLWNEKVWPTIEPFVKSLTNLKDMIVKAFSAWDTNKSIWENLKNIGGIVVDSVKKWWDTSPFKAFYENHLEPIIQSLGNLVKRIKTMWANFNWDENKSFIENMKNIASIIKDGVIQWWNDKDNPIRNIYQKHIVPIINKMKKFSKAIMDGISEWWKKSKLKEWIDKVTDKVKKLISTIGNAIWELPIIGVLRPFGFLIGKPIRLSNEEEAEFKDITEKREKADEYANNIKELKERIAKGDTEVGRLDFAHGLANYSYGTKLEDVIKDMETKQRRLTSQANEASARKIAQMQVEQAMQPVDSINQMNAEQNVKLSQQGQQMSEQMQKKEEAQQKYNADQYSFMMQMNQNIKGLTNAVEDQGKNPSVVTVPQPVDNSSYGTAQMQSPYASYAPLY